MKNEGYIVNVVVKYCAKFNIQRVCENISSIVNKVIRVISQEQKAQKAQKA